MATVADHDKTRFLNSLASRAFLLVFGAHFVVFGVMVIRTFTQENYELPFMSWVLWGIIILGTPPAYLSPRGSTYEYRAWLTQVLLLVSVAFGLANQGLGALTLFNIPFIAVMGAIFFSARIAFMQLGTAILIFGAFAAAKLTGILPDIANPDWVLNSDYRWVLRTVYISLFSLVIVYFLQQYIAYTFATVRDLEILQEAVDEAPDAFVVWDENDRLFMSNRRYRHLDRRLEPHLRRGISFEETLRTGIRIGMYPESEGNEEQWIAERLENHNLAESSKLVRLDDGRWMNVVESRTSSGFLAGFRTDVTALRNSEDLLQATLDSVSEAVVTLSESGLILNLNAASQDIFGYTLEELKGQHVLAIAPDAATTRLRRNVTQRARDSKIGVFENNLDAVLLRKGGETFAARLEVRDVEINGERVFLNFITDLSRERRFENTVQALGAAVEQLAAGFVLINEVHQITYSNTQFYSLLDIPNGNKLMGLSVDELFATVVRCDTGLRLSTQDDLLEGLRRLYRAADGPVTLLTSRGRHLQLRRQLLEGRNTILTLTDTTEDYQRQMQLEQSTKLATLGEMAAGIAHELNQPLNAIKLTALNLLRIHGASKDKAVAQMPAKLEQIAAQVDRAATITDHMRQSARQAGEEEAVAVLSEVVANSYLLVESGFRLEGIEFRAELAADLPVCKIHPVRLEQVLLNLLTNAKDAFVEREVAKDGRWIRVATVATDEDSVTLEVEDSAGGIPTEIIHRVFDPFYTTKDVGKGTGLGLSISYGILNDAGGRLSVTNTPKGARFRLVLPV